MKTKYLLATAFVLASYPVLAQSERDAANRAEATMGIAPTVQDFVTEATQSDMLEIETSKLAQGSGNTAIKAFADQMVADHSKTTAELKKAIADNKIYVTVTTTLDKGHQATLDKLKKLQGADFVMEYKNLQVSAHKNAASLFERYSEFGKNAQLKAWAGKTLPSLRHHLQMALDLETKS